MRPTRAGLLLPLALWFVSAPGFSGEVKNPASECSPEAQKFLGKATADSFCGDPNAWTAVNRLPAVRFVVFDPMTHSFGFVTPCVDSRGDQKTTWNQDFLDRQRLALTTQKIRLLVLPYLGTEGEVVFEATPGKGTEIAEFPGLAAAAQAQQAADKKEEKKDDEAQKPPPAPPARGDVNKVLNNIRVQLSLAAVSQRIVTEGGGPPETPMEAYEELSSINSELQQVENEAKESSDETELVALIESRFRTYYSRVNLLRGDLRMAEDDEACSRRHIRDLPRLFRQALVDDGSHFTLAQDATLCSVAEEAVRRTQAIGRIVYESCFHAKLPPDLKPSQEFDFDLHRHEQALRGVAGQIDELDELLDGIGRDLERLDAFVKLKKLKSPWPEALAAYKEELDKAQSYQSDLGSQLADLRNDLTAIEDDHATLQEVTGSPTSQEIHRINFNPLHDDEALTLKAAFRQPDGHKSDPVAEMVIKSTPVASIRFTSGLVVSRLKNPSFQSGPVPPSAMTTGTASAQAAGNAADPPPAKKVIQFKDEGNQVILPALMVHHYCGWRSSLLTPTLFERLMPTLSLGIPLAKTTGLADQVLLGLDWEVAAGVNVNAGIHYGEVNALSGGFKVGQEIDEKLDVSTIQRKRRASAFYFGIVLNSDIFQALQNFRR